MGKETNIGWTDATYNPWWGCAKVSSGCKHCYADTFQRRYGNDVFGYQADGSRKPLRTFGEKHWAEPLKWNREAQQAGIRKRVFCASMGDVFDDHPDAAPWRERLWELIRATPALDWQLLTKRPEHLLPMLPPDWGEGYPNVWLGTSVEHQATAGRAALLRAVPAQVRFLSCEPLVGEVRFRSQELTGIHWGIIGGESGPGARRMEEAWVDGLLADFARTGVRAFFKQAGSVLAREWRLGHPKGEQVSELPAKWQVQQFPR